MSNSLQSIDEHSDNPEKDLALGKTYFFRNEKTTAIPHLQCYIGLTADMANKAYALDLLGQCHEATEDHEAARSCYTQATAMMPSAASAWHNLGLLHIKLAEQQLESRLEDSRALFQQAQACLNQALGICATNPMFLHSIASWHEKYVEMLIAIATEEATQQETITQHFELAIQYYQRALTECHEDDTALKAIVTTNFTECLAQYGHHLYRSKNFEHALSLYFQALACDSEHLAVITQIGMTLFNQGRFSDARTYFSNILEKTTEPQELADAWLNMACTYRQEKRWDEAEHALDKAREFDPIDKDLLIHHEAQLLMDAKTQAHLVAAPQTLFQPPSTPPDLPTTSTKTLGFH